MDWTLALQRNHELLQRIVAHLFVWLKLEVGESVDTLPIYKKQTVYFVLRPSESAFRRLVLVAVFVLGTVAPPTRERGATTKRPDRKSDEKKQKGTAPPPFKLIDPRKTFDDPNKPKRPGFGPRITSFACEYPHEHRASIYAYLERVKRLREEKLGAKGLCNRLNALMAAMEDLPAQALRMAKLQERIKRGCERRGKPILRPLRPGLPPGYRQRHKHEVDEVLSECHTLAKWAMVETKPPDKA